MIDVLLEALIDRYFTSKEPEFEELVDVDEIDDKIVRDISGLRDGIQNELAADKTLAQSATGLQEEFPSYALDAAVYVLRSGLLELKIASDDAFDSKADFSGIKEPTYTRESKQLVCPLKSRGEIRGYVVLQHKQGKAVPNGRFAQIVNSYLTGAVAADGLIQHQRIIRLNEELKQLVAVIGHDGRNHVTPLRRYGEQLVEMAETIDPEDIRKAGRGIVDCTSKLLGTLGQAIEFAKTLEMRAMKYSQIDITSLSHYWTHELQPNAQVRGLEFTYDFPIQTIAADEEGVNRLVLNLISNAVRYARKHTKIRIYAREETRKGVDYIVYGVDNQMVGETPVNALDVVHMKSPKTYRMPGSQGLSEDSVGLGIHLSNLIMDKHGGGLDIKKNLVVECIPHFCIEAYFPKRELAAE